MIFFGFFYDLALHFLAIASLPKFFIHFRKYKGIFLKRLGIGFPQIEKRGRKLVWIHAVSLGETKAIGPLVKRLKKESESTLILLSTSTKTGHQEGLKNIPEADFHLYMPFDLRYVICPIVKRVAPNLVIITETDFWFHFQNASRKIGAKRILINGKISHRSFKRYLLLPFLSKHLLDLDHFYVQSDVYKKRFDALGIPPSKLTITGNLKLDCEIEQCNVGAVKSQLGLEDDHIVITLGSTHHPEEKLWIKTLKQLWPHFPRLKVLIVPRHPERFDEVAKLLGSEQIPFSRWSLGGTLHNSTTLLVDAMGVLCRYYQISDIAFVGGSFTTKVGGHNILEPAFFGKPVLFGPYMHSQPDLLELVSSYGAGIQVTQDTLFATLHNLLANPALCYQIGANGQKLTSSSCGALNHTVNALLPLLQKTPS